MIVGVNGGGKTTTLGKFELIIRRHLFCSRVTTRKFIIQVLVILNCCQACVSLRYVRFVWTGKLANRFKKEGVKVSLANR